MEFLSYFLVFPILIYGTRIMVLTCLFLPLDDENFTGKYFHLVRKNNLLYSN